MKMQFKFLSLKTLLFKFQIKNFDSISETSSQIRKSKEEIKKKLKDSIVNGARHENKELEKKASKVKITENASVAVT